MSAHNALHLKSVGGGGNGATADSNNNVDVDKMEVNRESSPRTTSSTPNKDADRATTEDRENLPEDRRNHSPSECRRRVLSRYPFSNGFFS